MSASADAASSSVCAMSRTTRLVFAEPLDQRFDLGQRLRVLPVLGRIALHLGGAEELHEFLVLPLDRCQLIEHFLPCVGALPPAPVPRPSTMLGTTLSLPKSRGLLVCHTSLPPETGGRNATSSPSRSTVSIRA